MKNFTYLLILGVILTSCTSKTSNLSDNNPKSPNILLVMVDDMGWTDIGPYGGEINTPTIDRLTKNGTQFTDFHTSVSCSPTRSMLLSSVDNHMAGLGNMGELLSPNQIGKPGYEGYLNQNVASLAEVLKEVGYHTYMGGKWHLGHDKNSIPSARGFEKTFCILNGGASHFHDMTAIMEADSVEYALNGKKLDKLPKDFYSSKSYTDFLINNIREQEDDQPFFAYLALTAPHDPLHVPEPWLSKYKGMYDEGYEILRANRIKQVKDLGLINEVAKTPKMNQLVKPWQSLSKSKKAIESKNMEVYAGMIENLDYHMGRMLNFLSDISELENTIVLFLSDNGSNPWSNTDYPGNGDGVYLSQFDNSINNIGNPTSHMAYGIGWASASSGPFDYFKMTSGEGGIRTPLIMSGPGVSKNTINKELVYVTDIMPTLLDMIGIELIDSYRGKKVLPLMGKSFSKMLNGENSTHYSDKEYIAGEMQNGKWIRKGDFKAVFITKPYGSDKWELYNLAVDPGETTNLAALEKELLKDLVQEWEKYAEEVGVVEFE
ncbi:arylsulfatase [uncultured Algibacter sp.]|uniref:arylsulfatase n=1 Tax=uncultured Algibacter sp. TaxID=298659 RepID=UPI0026288885|nr:arylsulfatase [uncultured Algibacter sp.]